MDNCVKYIFRIELPPPESGNKTLRTHWSKRRKDNNNWAWTILGAFKEAGVDRRLPKQTKKRYIVFYLESCKPQDDNNFQLSIKGLVDELQEGRTIDAVIDDSPQYCRVFYIPIKTNVKKRKMFMELYEEDDFLTKIRNDQEFFNLIFSAS